MKADDWTAQADAVVAALDAGDVVLAMSRAVLLARAGHMEFFEKLFELHLAGVEQGRPPNASKEVVDAFIRDREIAESDISAMPLEALVRYAQDLRERIAELKLAGGVAANLPQFVLIDHQIGLIMGRLKARLRAFLAALPPAQVEQPPTVVAADNPPESPLRFYLKWVWRRPALRRALLVVALPVVVLVTLWKLLPNDYQVRLLDAVVGTTASPETSRPDKTHVPETHTNERIPTSVAGFNFTAFEVLERNVLLDLTSWSRVKDSERRERRSIAIRTERMKIRKTLPTQNWYLHEVFTTGLAPDVTCGGRRCEIVEYPYAPKLGREVLRHFAIWLDVSEETTEIPFNVTLEIGLWNAFLNDRSGWFAAQVKYPTRLVTLEARFSDRKPFHAFELKAYPKDGDPTTAFDGTPEVEVTSGRRIAWAVRQPAIRYSYRLVWQW